MMPIETLTGLDAITFLAYLDPGLGSMQYQMIVAGILSTAFFFKTSLIQARHLLGRMMRRGS